MYKILSKLQKNLILSIPLFMVFGLIYGVLFDTNSLKTAILPFTFLMVYPMMVTLNIKELANKGDSKLQVTAQAINFIIIPALGYFVGKTFFPDNTLVVLGFLITSLLPTSGMTISWTGFANGNIIGAIKMTVIGLILGSLLAPLYLKVIMGAAVSIPLVSVFKQIAIIVFLPMLAGFLTQSFLIKKYGKEKYQKELKMKFPPLSTAGVLGIVFVAMALKAESIIASPDTLLGLIIPLTILYVANFILSTLIGKIFFKKEDAIALVYGTVMRNLSIALAIAMSVFGDKGSDIALVIAMGYIIQVQSAAWYVKFTDRIFNNSRAIC